MSGRCYVFTDADLDGVGSFMVSRWLKGITSFTTTTHKHFREDFVRWLSSNKLSDYEKVYIFDINVAEHFDLLDHPNVNVIDHHNGKDGYVNFSKATLVLDQDFSSTTKLVLKTFLREDPSLSSKLTHQIAKFVNLVDDYDSYKLALPDSIGLNNVLWSYTGNRVTKFLEEFSLGFNGFSTFHKNMIAIAEKKVQDTVNTVDTFMVNFPIDGKERKVVCIQCDHNINEVAFEVLKKHNADICLVVNLKSKSVSFRKSKSCNVNLSKLANKLCDGGGHSDSAGGAVNEKFLKLSKMFTKI